MCRETNVTAATQAVLIRTSVARAANSCRTESPNHAWGAFRLDSQVFLVADKAFSSILVNTYRCSPQSISNAKNCGQQNKQSEDADQPSDNLRT